jgi:hypothetical protein
MFASFISDRGKRSILLWEGGGYAGNFSDLLDAGGKIMNPLPYTEIREGQELLPERDQMCPASCKLCSFPVSLL